VVLALLLGVGGGSVQQAGVRVAARMHTGWCHARQRCAGCAVTIANTQHPRHHTQQGEQHGFRKAESIRSCLEGEFYFFGRVLAFPATYSADLQPMHIDNLDPPVEPEAAGGSSGGDKTEL
jgi:hypothetical protein